MRIERKRWVIMRNNRTEIYCGLAKDFKFKKIREIEIENIAIKTYMSEKKALSGFKTSWGETDFDVEAVAITEVYEATQG